MSQLIITFLKDKYNLLGIYFLLVQILIIFSIPFEYVNLFIWFCNHNPFLIAIAFFTKKFQLVKALICIGFIPQLVWTIDFLSYLILNFHIIGVTEIVFQRETHQIIINTITHVFTTFVAFFAIIKTPVLKDAYYYSAIYALLLFLVTILFTDISTNINCMDKICGFENLSPPFYTILWPIYSFILLFIPMLLFQNQMFKLVNKKYFK